MFIYFRLILCFLNPFIQLERYNNWKTLHSSDTYSVKKYRRSNKILSINIIKSTGERSHKQWYFRPRFK